MTIPGDPEYPDSELSPSAEHDEPSANDTETLLRRVTDVIANARPMPLSASVMINRDEVLELLEEAITRLPDDLRQARWMLKEREEFQAKAKREADDILDEARNHAQRMVQRTEVVRAAQQTARRTIERADEEARRLRLEAEDFCDQKLAQFEIVLDRTLKVVQAGRARLQGTEGTPQPEQAPVAEEGDGEGKRLFDQDQET